VNILRGLGEKIKNSIIVQKILRSLAMRFDPKILSLEERQNLAMLSMDELHGILTTYEMRTKHENSSKREATFSMKASSIFSPSMEIISPSVTASTFVLDTSLYLCIWHQWQYYPTCWWYITTCHEKISLFLIFS